MNMCTALQELENKGRKQGRMEGKIEGKIEGIVKICKEFDVSEETAAEKLQRECGLKNEDAMKFVVKYYTTL